METVDFVAAVAHLGAGGRPGPLPALGAPASWSNVLRLAVEHRVAPLLAEAIAQAPDEAVPLEIREALRAETFRSAATRLLCEQTLADMVGGLRAAGVEVIVLKGPTVAHTVYPRPELRMYHDIDVLCRVADYPQLYQTLLARGYTSAGTLEARGTHERLADKPSAKESHSVRGFYDPSHDVKVEVHFDMLQLGLQDRSEQRFWSDSLRREVAGVEILTLAPEHQFLHLAVHAHRHGYSRLSWLIEIDLLMRRAHDWGRMLEVARLEGVGAMLRHALATAHAVLGAPLPELPPATLEESCLGVCYRMLWPFERTRSLNQHEHHRLLHFLPDDADPRNVLYGLALVGRRRDKLQALLGRLRKS